MLIGLNTTSTYSRSDSCPISLDAMCPFPSATLDKQERERKKIGTGKNRDQFRKKMLLSSVLTAISNNSEYSMPYEKQGYCYHSQSYQNQKKKRLKKKILLQ